jgi:hypothetical protein
MKHFKAWQTSRMLSDIMANQGLAGRSLPKRPKRKRLRKKLTKRFFGDFKEGSGDELRKVMMDMVVWGQGAIRISEDGAKHVPLKETLK